MATKGAVSEQSALVQAWFSYIESDEGIQIIQRAGVMPAKSNTANAAPAADATAQ